LDSNDGEYFCVTFSTGTCKIQGGRINRAAGEMKSFPRPS